MHSDPADWSLVYLPTAPEAVKPHIWSFDQECSRRLSTTPILVIRHPFTLYDYPSLKRRSHVHQLFKDYALPTELP